jgi:hypothetical protein
MMKSKGIFSVMGLAASMAVVLASMGACSSSSSSGGSSSFSCSAKGPCANDPTPDQATIDSCNKLRADANCGAKVRAFEDCNAVNGSCGSDGKSTLTQACAQQFADALSCIPAGSHDAGAD